MADSFLTRKIGPLPAWGWAAAGAGIYLVYRLRKSQSAASTSPTTSAAGSAAPSGYGDYLSGGGGQATLQTPSGFSYSGPAPYLTNPSLQSLFSGGAVAATPGSVTSPQVASTLTGSGYYTPGDPNYIASMTQVQGLQASGAPIYYQPTVGTFLQAPSGLSGLAPGTPLYSQAA